MAVDSGTYDDATIARKQKIADALFLDSMKPKKIEHWAQGLSSLAHAGLGGYLANQANEEAKSAETGLNAAHINFLQPKSDVSVGPVNSAPGPVSAPSTPAAPTVGKIYGPNESSPLDPPVGGDEDKAVRTILAESGNQGPAGMQAVASVIRNRAVNGGYGGDTPTGVVTAPNQFEPWNTAGGRAKMAAIDPNSPQYRAAAEALSRAYAGDDPTNGALNFFAPKAQAALGRDVPAWGRGPGQDIGDHRFFGSPVAAESQPAPYQVAGPNTPPPANPVAAALSASPQATPAAPANDTKSRIVGLLNSTNPQERKLGRALAQQVIAADVKKDPLDIEAKQLDVATKRKALEAAPAVQRVKQPDGSELAVQWDSKKGEWVPLKAPEGGNSVGSPKLTEQQSKDVGFYNRGQKLLPRLEQQDKELTDFLSTAGGSVSNYLKSDKFRNAEQTGKELLAVILRKDTGAAVTPSEMEQYSSIYLPRPGDDAATVQQKRVARATAIEGLRMGLGPAEIIFKSREAAEAAKPKEAVEATPGPKPAGISGATKSGIKWSVE